MTLRTAVPADIDAVLRLWAVSAENADRPTDTTHAVQSLLERDPEALVLAVDGDEIVGTLITGWDGWRASLYRLAVLPDRRRRGIGTLLLQEAYARFARVGGIRIDAMVLEGNAEGQRLWAAAGFDRQDGWRRWVRPVDVDG